MTPSPTPDPTQGQVVDTDAYRSGADRTGAAAAGLHAEVQRFLGEVSDASVLGRRDTIGQYANPMYSVAVGYVGKCLGELAGSYDDHARALAGSGSAYRGSEQNNSAAAAGMFDADPGGTHRSGDWTPDGPVQRQAGPETDRSLDRWKDFDHNRSFDTGDTRFDRDGFDRAGYDREGYDRGGFDRAGFNREGFDRDGFDRDGFGRDGFGRDGFGRDGFDRDGFGRDGFGPEGLPVDGPGSGTSAAGLGNDPLAGRGADGLRGLGGGAGVGADGAASRGLGPAGAAPTPNGASGGGYGIDPRLGRAGAPAGGFGGSLGPAGGMGGPMPMGAGGRRKDDQRGKAASKVEDESLDDEKTDDQTSIWDSLRPTTEEDQR